MTEGGVTMSLVIVEEVIVINGSGSSTSCLQWRYVSIRDLI